MCIIVAFSNNITTKLLNQQLTLKIYLKKKLIWSVIYGIYCYAHNFTLHYWNKIVKNKGKVDKKTGNANETNHVKVNTNFKRTERKIAQELYSTLHHFI